MLVALAHTTADSRARGWRENRDRRWCQGGLYEAVVGDDARADALAAILDDVAAATKVGHAAVDGHAASAALLRDVEDLALRHPLVRVLPEDDLEEVGVCHAAFLVMPRWRLSARVMT
jgi:hypothetical protein